MPGMASKTYFKSTTRSTGASAENARKRGSLPSWARMRHATRPMSRAPSGIALLADQRDEDVLERVVPHLQLLDAVEPSQPFRQLVSRVGEPFLDGRAAGRSRDGGRPAAGEELVRSTLDQHPAVAEHEQPIAMARLVELVRR